MKLLFTHVIDGNLKKENKSGKCFNDITVHVQHMIYIKQCCQPQSTYNKTEKSLVDMYYINN